MSKKTFFVAGVLTLIACACGGGSQPAPTSTRPPAQATSAPTATRGATAIPTATLAPFNAGNAPTAAPSPAPTVARATVIARPTSTLAPARPASTATPPPRATQPPAPTPEPAPSLGGLVITLQASGYETWGRPAGMDDKNKGCGGFDDAKPVTKFNVSMRVTNTTSKDISADDWYAYMLKGDGKQAYVCFYGYTGGSAFPSIPAGQSRDVTFAAFIERGEIIRSAYVRASNVGVSNSLGF